VNQHVFDVEIPMDYFFVEKCLAAEDKLCYDQLGFTLGKSLV
jgi:hypothetical protein